MIKKKSFGLGKKKQEKQYVPRENGEDGCRSHYAEKNKTNCMHFINSPKVIFCFQGT